MSPAPKQFADAIAKHQDSLTKLEEDGDDDGHDGEGQEEDLEEEMLEDVVMLDDEVQEHPPAGDDPKRPSLTGAPSTQSPAVTKTSKTSTSVSKSSSSPIPGAAKTSSTKSPAVTKTSNPIPAVSKAPSTKTSTVASAPSAQTPVVVVAESSSTQSPALTKTPSIPHAPPVPKIAETKDSGPSKPPGPPRPRRKEKSTLLSQPIHDPKTAPLPNNGGSLASSPTHRPGAPIAGLTLHIPDSSASSHPQAPVTQLSGSEGPIVPPPSIPAQGPQGGPSESIEEGLLRAGVGNVSPFPTAPGENVEPLKVLEAISGELYGFDDEDEDDEGLQVDDYDGNTFWAKLATNIPSSNVTKYVSIPSCISELPSSSSRTTDSAPKPPGVEEQADVGEEANGKQVPKRKKKAGPRKSTSKSATAKKDALQDAASTNGQVASSDQNAGDDVTPEVANKDSDSHNVAASTRRKRKTSPVPPPVTEGRPKRARAGVVLPDGTKFAGTARSTKGSQADVTVKPTKKPRGRKAK